MEAVIVDPSGADCGAVRRAVSVVDRGGLLVFPTETVYGVGARADLPAAIGRLRRLKGRTDGKPFTVHVAEPGDAECFVPSMPALGRRLIRKGWPGPLTLLFHVSDVAAAPIMRDREERLAHELYRNREIGLRCPDHDIARSVLSGVGGPMVAASANRAGRPPSRTPDEALSELGAEVDLVLSAGPAQHGGPSTVVRVRQSDYEVVREGVYDARTLRRLASVNFLFVCTGNTCRSPMAAGLFERALADALVCSASKLSTRHITVRSAGTGAGGGSGPSTEAVEVLRRRQIDIGAHRSTCLSPELINEADHIYAMTSAHAEAVAALVPSARFKTRLISDEGPIDDPIGGSVAVYDSCAAKIERAVAARVAEIDL